ncbi:hypothetical protein QO014_000173 [Kaistia dalseonensis]|uniref:Uncharacterized protein n=1 Tax=Kaistia dalseonensis TaxID=410840 RepID=A0ABU0H0G8_9HYPH|nr:hypothetical protein [Kaistia dalseonensis]
MGRGRVAGAGYRLFRTHRKQERLGFAKANPAPKTRGAFDPPARGGLRGATPCRFCHPLDLARPLSSAVVGPPAPSSPRKRGPIQPEHWEEQASGITAAWVPGLGCAPPGMTAFGEGALRPRGRAHGTRPTSRTVNAPSSAQTLPPREGQNRKAVLGRGHVVEARPPPSPRPADAHTKLWHCRARPGNASAERRVGGHLVDLANRATCGYGHANASSSNKEPLDEPCYSCSVT